LKNFPDFEDSAFDLRARAELALAFDPGQPSVREMTVKSWINSPGAKDGPASSQIKAGMTQIQGVAFGGLHAVRGVEVSVDGGKSWQAAWLVGPDLGKYAWRQFLLQARLALGAYTLASPATDTAGNVQPDARGENQSGYNNTSWADHAVRVTAARASRRHGAAGVSCGLSPRWLRFSVLAQSGRLTMRRRWRLAKTFLSMQCRLARYATP